MLVDWVEKEPEEVLALLAKEAVWVRQFGPMKQANGFLEQLGSGLRAAPEYLRQHMQAAPEYLRQHLPGSLGGVTAPGFLSQLGDYGRQAWESPHTQRALIGAGIGGAAGLASGSLREPEDRHPFSSAMTGALAGGAAGLGGSLAWEGLKGLRSGPAPSRTPMDVSANGMTLPAGMPLDAAQRLHELNETHNLAGTLDAATPGLGNAVLPGAVGGVDLWRSAKRTGSGHSIHPEGLAPRIEKALQAEPTMIGGQHFVPADKPFKGMPMPAVDLLRQYSPEERMEFTHGFSDFRHPSGEIPNAVIRQESYPARMPNLPHLPTPPQNADRALWDNILQHHEHARETALDNATQARLQEQLDAASLTKPEIRGGAPTIPESQPFEGLNRKALQGFKGLGPAGQRKLLSTGKDFFHPEGTIPASILQSERALGLAGEGAAKPPGFLTRLWRQAKEPVLGGGFAAESPVLRALGSRAVAYPAMFMAQPLANAARKWYENGAERDDLLRRYGLHPE